MGLLPGTTYYYRVKAVNANQESEYSDVVAVTTLPNNSVTVTSLPASTPELFRVSPTFRHAEIYLQLPFVNENIEEYKVILSTNSDLSNPILDRLTYVVNRNTNYAVVNQVRYLVLAVNGLNASTTYYVQITACNSISSSAPLSLTFATPANLVAPVASGVRLLTSSSARLLWGEVPNATGYRVTLANNSNFTSPIVNDTAVSGVTSTSFDVSALTASTTYFFRIRAVNGSILSDFSRVQSFTTTASGVSSDNNTIDTLVNLANPSITNIREVYTTTFQLEWSLVEGADGYRVDLATVPDFSSFVSSNLTTANTRYTFSNLNPGVTYFARVRAFDTLNVSSFTSTSVTTLTVNNSLNPPQAIPVSLVRSTGLVFTWVKRTYATKYLVQLSTSNTFSDILQSLYVGDIDRITVENLSPSTVYFLRVFALTETQSSSASNNVTATTSANLPAINLLTTTDITDTSVKLNWQVDSSYSKYYLSIYKKISAIQSNFLGNGFFNKLNVGNTSNYTVDLFLEPSTTYSYFIIGETSLGDTRMSVLGEFTTQAKAPVIQISSNGRWLEWSGSLTQIEVSTDADFKSLLPGWQPRTVSNTGSFDITGLLLEPTCYYIRGYDVVGGLNSKYSNVVSTIQNTPIFVAPTVTKTTALVRWKPSQTISNYSVQLLVESGANNYIPASGFTFPLNIGDTDYYLFSNLTANTNYAVTLFWLNPSHQYESTLIPLYFKTNRFDSIGEVTQSGTPVTGTTSSVSFDRYTLTTTASTTYLVEMSRRSVFAPIHQYYEFTGTTVTVSAEPNSRYFVRLYAFNGSTRTPVSGTLTINTSALPAAASTLPTAPTITVTTTLNTSESTLEWTSISNATGYTVEISESSTFELLDKLVTVVYLSSTKALLTGLSSAKTYYARVYAFNASSISPYSGSTVIDV